MPRNSETKSFSKRRAKKPLTVPTWPVDQAERRRQLYTGFFNAMTISNNASNSGQII